MQRRQVNVDTAVPFVLDREIRTCSGVSDIDDQKICAGRDRQVRKRLDATFQYSRFGANEFRAAGRVGQVFDMIRSLQLMILSNSQHTIYDFKRRINVVVGIAGDRTTASQYRGTEWGVFPAKLVAAVRALVNDMPDVSVRCLGAEINTGVEELVIVVEFVAGYSVNVTRRETGNSDPGGSRWNEKISRRCPGCTRSEPGISPDDILKNTADNQRIR